MSKKVHKKIPVIREALADLDTPLSVYLKLANEPFTYLLESAQVGSEDGGKWDRYSIIGMRCSTRIRVVGTQIDVFNDDQIVESLSTSNPLSFIEEFQSRYQVADCDQDIRFIGGLVGYFGYDTVRYVEPKLLSSCPKDNLNTPDIFLMVSEDIIVFDNLKGRMKLVSLANQDDPDSIARTSTILDTRVEKLEKTSTPDLKTGENKPLSESDFSSEYGEKAFKEDVEKIKEYTRTGDIMQVVLSQRMSVPFDCPPINLYRSLRNLNPSPYMYFMDMGDFQIVSSSPEILARLEKGKITNRPLAGTRRRGHDPDEDIRLEVELKNDPKELAEHLMLIDLGRNDVGKVSRAGSVCVTEKFVIERYSHVMHLSSNIEGDILPEKNALDLLRATLPVGTLSGAPKVRAMEIIDELEPTKRGIYGGAVGYISWNGNMDTAIAIRTAVVQDKTLYIQSGGGIVHDSVPDLEWKESLNKGRAIFRAAAMAATNFEIGTSHESWEKRD